MSLKRNPAMTHHEDGRDKKVRCPGFGTADREETVILFQEQDERLFGVFCPVFRLCVRNGSVVCDILRHIDQIEDVETAISVQIIVLNIFIVIVQDNIVQQDHISESRSEIIRKSDP